MAVMDRPAVRCEGTRTCDRPATHTARREGRAPMELCDRHAKLAQQVGWTIEERKP